MTINDATNVKGELLNGCFEQILEAAPLKKQLLYGHLPLISQTI